MPPATNDIPDDPGEAKIPSEADYTHDDEPGSSENGQTYQRVTSNTLKQIYDRYRET